eukprot:gb/GFBE01021960.1/.p1 GENE.gb/GFBE01021960.1/~~gb/GFBE01021960.1/.p1  ORF type:complete len:282 (+),score=37.13 gb/GFBE01021960.1/:1-846(+)
MSKKKKKEEKTLKDKILLWSAIVAAIIFLVCCIPKVGYRVSEKYTRYHFRFSMQRKYSLWGATDRFDKVISWTSLRKETCAKMREFESPDLLKMLVSTGTAAAGSSGNLAGCAAWPLCKEVTQIRCSEYTTMMAVSIFCLIANIVGAGLLLAVPMLINFEFAVRGKGKKKHKKKFEAVTLTTSVTAGGFILPLLSWALFMGLSDSMFHTFKKREAYPYGAAWVGHYLHGFGCFMTILCFVLALWRYWQASGPYQKDDSSDDEGELQIDDGGFVGPPGLPGL